MVVQGIHHFSITAPAQMLEQLVAFYGELLDLTPGFRPTFSFDGFWLYAGDQPLLHLLADEGRQPQPPGFFDHIALRCQRLVDTLAKLEQMGLKYQRFDIVELNQAQLFVRDPAGTVLELNFCGE